MCEHRNTSYVWRHQPDGTERAIARFCDDCGATLSLGAARDTTQVVREIRAAAIAVGAKPNLAERAGWDAFGLDLIPGTDAASAGWLAHAIVVHHQLQEVDGCPAPSVLDCTDPDCERHFGEHHAAPDLVELDVVVGAEPEEGVAVPVAVSTDVDVPPGWNEDMDAMERAATAAETGGLA